MTRPTEQWRELMSDMAQLEQELLAVAPACDLTRAEGTRYLARLLRYTIGRYIDRSRSPAQPDISHEAARVGGDNPDYRYGIADLDGRLRYRLRLRRNEAARLGIGTYAGGLGTSQGLICTGYFNVDAGTAPGAEEVELILATEAGPGHWLPMTPASNSLIIRELILDRARHQPATFSLECLTDVRELPPMPPPNAAELDAGLERARGFLRGTVRQFIGWTESFMRFPNELRPLDPALLGAAQGDPATHYFNGYYELQPGEALLVEFTAPVCEYWNLQACNHWLESLDVQVRPAHINHFTAEADTGGRIRAVITPENPGVANWIDTVGHQRGCLALRWVGLEPGALPPPLQCRVVSLASLGS